jgi:ATP-binding cassette subfamily B protein
MLLQWIVTRLSYKNSYTASQHAMARMRRSIVERMRRMPLGAIESAKSGEFINAFTTDPDKLDQSIAFFLPQIISMGTLTLLSAGLLFSYDWRLALPMYLMVPVCIAILTVAVRLRYHHAGSIRDAKATAATGLNEYLRGMRNLKSYNQTGSGFHTLTRAYEALCRETTKDEGLPGALTLLAGHMIHFGVPAIIFAGAMLLGAGRVDVTILLAFLILATRLYTPLVVAVSSVINLRASAVSAERINTLLATPTQSGEREAPQAGAIRLRNVSFGYDDDRRVISDVSFQADENKLCALVGPSGSGKTTLTRLIARVWDPTSGEILIGDTPIRTLDPR